jgi:transketolase
LGHDKIQLDTYKKRFESFGWVAVVIDGHNMLEIIDALEKAKRSNYPFCIIGKTFKGRNYGKDVENNKSYHGKPLGD